MVYLLHFDPAFKRIRHWAGATSNAAEIAALERADPSLLRTPIVTAARAHGIAIRVGRTWPTRYHRVDELPYANDRRRLCLTCLDAERERRSQ